MSGSITQAAEKPEGSQYSRVAALLHWLIAVCVLAMIGLGLFGSSVETDVGETAIAVHKVLGITVLGLTLVRILWRLTHPAPALPASMAPIMRIAAHGVHMGFYILLLAMPLSGWWMTSAFPQRHPIEALFFDIPFLPVPVNMASAGAAHEVHEIGAWLMIALVVLHISAALKHHFINRDDVLLRMSLRRKS